MGHEVSKLRWTNGPDGLAGHRWTCHKPSVRENATSLKHSEPKCNRTRCASMWLSQVKDNLFEDKADFFSFLGGAELSFIWGKMEIVVWDSISGSSEKLLQTSSGGRSTYKVLVKGVFSAVKRFFYERLSASHEELMSP